MLRRRSHYGRNDGDGDGTVTFRRSHYTLRTVTVTVTATVDVTMAATATVTVTFKVTVDEVRRRLSDSFANEEGNDGYRREENEVQVGHRHGETVD